MLVYTHKVFDTIVVPGTIEECDPALWSELARASDFFVTLRASDVGTGVEYFIEAQTSNDGRRWVKMFDQKHTPAAGSISLTSLSAFQASRGCKVRFRAYQNSTGICRVECWVTGRARGSRVNSVDASSGERDLRRGDMRTNVPQKKGPPSQKAASARKECGCSGCKDDGGGHTRAGAVADGPISRAAVAIGRDVKLNRAPKRSSSFGFKGANVTPLGGDRVPTIISSTPGEPIPSDRFGDPPNTFGFDYIPCVRWREFDPRDYDALVAEFQRVEALFPVPALAGFTSADGEMVSFGDYNRSRTRAFHNAIVAYAYFDEAAGARLGADCANALARSGLGGAPGDPEIDASQIADTILKLVGVNRGCYLIDPTDANYSCRSEESSVCDICTPVTTYVDSTGGLARHPYPTFISPWFQLPRGLWVWSDPVNCIELSPDISVLPPSRVCPPWQELTPVVPTPSQKALLLEAARVAHDIVVDEFGDTDTFSESDYNSRFDNLFIVGVRSGCPACSGAGGFSDADLGRLAELTTGEMSLLPTMRRVSLHGLRNEAAFGPDSNPILFNCR